MNLLARLLPLLLVCQLKAVAGKEPPLPPPAKAVAPKSQPGETGDSTNPFFALCMDTHDARKRSLAAQAELLRELGYDGAGHLWLSQVDERLRTLDAAGLELFQIYLRLDISPNAKQPYDARLQEILPLLRGRKTMLAVLVSGGKPSDATADSRAVALLRELADRARPFGVRIALYPHVNNWLERVEDALRVTRKVDRANVGVMFNLCHWLKVARDDNPRPLLEAALPHLLAVTINGSDRGPEVRAGAGRWIVPLDTGTFDMQDFLRTLKALGYTGPIGLQCYGIPGDARDHLTRSMNAWRKLNRALAKPGLTPVNYRIQLDTVHTGFDHQTCWVHARAGAIPGNPPAVVLTMQKLLLTGSDVFYALNDLRTDDWGRTWTGPTEHAATLGRRNESNGVIVAACDFWPAWHVRTGKLLGIGQTVRYRNNRVIPNRQRETCYSIYDEKQRTWTPWTTLEMPDAARFYNAGAGSVQRLDLPNGDILLPIYFKGRNEKYTRVVVLRCQFDGRKLSVIELGNELAVNTRRGLAEPSLTQFQSTYFLTLRHDLAGYVTRSRDGLHFDPPRQWRWEDGTELGNYNTQQHWVTHRDALFLVYTRRGANNNHVFRHRAPLFMAQVDPKRLCVIRSTERVLVPERGARLGNFGVTRVNERETWVTVTEWMQTTGPNPYDYTVPMKHGADNAVFVARILWDQPHRALPQP